MEREERDRRQKGWSEERNEQGGGRGEGAKVLHVRDEEDEEGGVRRRAEGIAASLKSGGGSFEALELLGLAAEDVQTEQLAKIVAKENKLADLALYYSAVSLSHADVHVTADNVIIVFHDPHLDRTTNGTGRIQTQNYHNGLDQLRTNKSPHQKIPTFKETIDLLMREGNEHVLLNIDIKVDNEPEKLFGLMREIVESHEGFETRLAPRLLLGLWHPKYIEPAVRHLPYCRRAHIGMSPALARRYFWDACDTFSMNFASMCTNEGERFRSECQREGKDLTVWTVNARNEMIEATKWGAKAILTDRTKELLDLRAEMEQDWDKVARETTALFKWSSVWYSGIANYLISSWEAYLLTKVGGAFRPAPPVASVPLARPPPAARVGA